MAEYPDASERQVNEILTRSSEAFNNYSQVALSKRASLLREVANFIEGLGDSLIETAMEETHLTRDRLVGERNRTLFQLRSYAEACEKGEWLKARIDTADANRIPPKPDTRKTLVPLGPVVVFGASNFPFAYSTAGGDTACALAAGCTVIIKAHPAHPQTSEKVAAAIKAALDKCSLPEAVFEHVHGASVEVGKWLVCHPLTKAVGFTGSYVGGKALFDWAAKREAPIPVFAEMGSVNPIYLLPGKLESEARNIAKMVASSVTLSCGQFCTNPGILVAISGEGLTGFKEVLAAEIRKVSPATMLHPGIATAFTEKITAVLQKPSVSLLAESGMSAEVNQGIPTLAAVAAAEFLRDNRLQQEIFGPYSILVECRDAAEMLEVARKMEGQLTSTIIGTDEELKQNHELLIAIQSKCGRLIFNGVPTGVEVCLSMHHGGPFPATTDSRFTSVGADGISRFARPVCFQDCPDELLPTELKKNNPSGILRTVNNIAGFV